MPALQPFEDIPRIKFLKRIWPAAVAVFFLGLICSGILYESEWYRGMAGVEGPAVVRSPMGSVTELYGKFFRKLSHYHDEVCWSDDPINELQKRQCDLVTLRTEIQAALVLLPFAVTLAFLFFALDSLAFTYKRSRKRLREGKVVFSGVVTQPAETANDFYGWIYCFQSIGVQLPNQTQLRVYVPEDVPTPLPGQKMSIFGGEKIWKAPRYTAVVYAPHVSVMRGT